MFTVPFGANNAPRFTNWTYVKEPVFVAFFHCFNRD